MTDLTKCPKCGGRHHRFNGTATAYTKEQGQVHINNYRCESCGHGFSWPEFRDGLWRYDDDAY